MPVTEERPLKSSSTSANVDAIQSKDFLDGRPGFFGSSEGAGVGDCEVLAATTGGVDVDVDVMATGGGCVGLSGPPASSTTSRLAAGAGAGCSRRLWEASASSGTVAGAGTGGWVEDVLSPLPRSGVLWLGAEGERLWEASASSGTVAGAGTGGWVEDVLSPLPGSEVLWLGAEGDRDGLLSPPASLGTLGWAA